MSMHGCNTFEFKGFAVLLGFKVVQPGRTVRVFCPAVTCLSHIVCFEFIDHYDYSLALLEHSHAQIFFCYY